MSSPGKVRRSYDAAGRKARAMQRRDEILEHGRALLLADGYAATTVAAIASASSVSPETVYKVFGGKPGIVKAIFERSLLGSAQSPPRSGPTPPSWPPRMRPRSSRGLASSALKSRR